MQSLTKDGIISDPELCLADCNGSFAEKYSIDMTPLESRMLVIRKRLLTISQFYSHNE